LTREALHSLIQAFVHCRLDYCNSALAESPVHLQKLQSVQNMAASRVSGVRRFEHVAPVLEDLQWLPVSHLDAGTLIYNWESSA